MQHEFAAKCTRNHDKNTNRTQLNKINKHIEFVLAVKLKTLNIITTELMQKIWIFAILNAQVHKEWFGRSCVQQVNRHSSVNIYAYACILPYCQYTVCLYSSQFTFTTSMSRGHCTKFNQPIRVTVCKRTRPLLVIVISTRWRNDDYVGSNIWFIRFYRAHYNYVREKINNILGQYSIINAQPIRATVTGNESWLVVHCVP